jgi:protein regulator of cytokinesis 1
MSGSENWETYEDDSEPELDTYYKTVRATRSKMMAGHHQQHHNHSHSHQDAIKMQHGHREWGSVDAQENRVLSGSGDEEDAF